MQLIFKRLILATVLNGLKGLRVNARRSGYCRNPEERDNSSDLGNNSSG